MNTCDSKFNLLYSLRDFVMSNVKNSWKARFSSDKSDIRTSSFDGGGTFGSLCSGTICSRFSSSRKTESCISTKCLSNRWRVKRRGIQVEGHTLSWQRLVRGRCSTYDSSKPSYGSESYRRRVRGRGGGTRGAGKEGGALQPLVPLART